MPQLPRSKPPRPPRSASTTLSTNTCRINRQRPAPSAARTVNSCARPAIRASRRLAKFAQAIRRTKPTAPKRTRSAGRMFPTIRSCNETRTVWRFLLSSGSASAMR
jgi:hypothetical protein